MRKKRNRGTFRLCLAGSAMIAASCNKDVQFTSGSQDAKPKKVEVQQEFDAALLNSETVTFKPLFGLVNEQITLKEKPPTTSTLHQVDRAVIEDDFTQGHDGKATTEGPFDVTMAGKLDMVIVVDNSSSMTAEQTNLSSGLANLLSSIQNTDWQIAVTTSTDYDPCLRDINGNGPGTILKRSDYDANPTAVVNNFKTLISAGVSGDYNERSLFGARRALDPSFQNNNRAPDAYDSYTIGVRAACPTNNWVRSDSALAVLVLSDEDNCHKANPITAHHSVLDGTNTTPAGDPANDGCPFSEYNGTDLLNTFKTMGRTPGTNAKVYAIYWPYNTVFSGVGSVSHSQYANAGWAYGGNGTDAFKGLIAQTGGTGGVIGDASYATTLKAISDDVAKIVVRQFKLKNPPMDGTLQVNVDGSSLGQGNYDVNGSTIVLHDGAAAGKQITFQYTYGATPKFTQVKLSQKPAPGTMQVTMNGAAVDDSDESYDDNAAEINFVNMPADDAKIQVKYRTHTDLPNNVDTAALKIDGDPLSVTVNGQAADYQYDAQGHKLTFTQTPTDNAAIAVTYKTPDRKITSYPAPSADDADHVISVKVTDAKSGDAVNATNDGPNLDFSPDDVVDGRAVNVTYDYGDKSTVLSHPLKYKPLDGTVQLKVDDGSPDCVDNIAVVDQKVQFNCNGEKLGELQLSYQYVQEHYTTFTVDQPFPPKPDVHVFIDGKETKNFTRDGQVVTIPEDATTINSKVRIIAGGSGPG